MPGTRNLEPLLSLLQHCWHADDPPRLHGSRRQLEGLLKRLARYCQTLDSSTADKSYDPFGADPGTAALPRSFEKLSRMLKRLQANQFVSFTE